MEKTERPIWIIVSTIVITAIIIGGGIYYWQNKKLTDSKNDLNAQIASLQKQVNDLKTASTTVVTTPSTSTSTTTTTADSTADWKTYADSANGFSIKYPGEWLVKQQDGSVRIQNKTGDIYASNEGVKNVGKIQGSYVEITVSIKTSSQTLSEYLKANIDSGAKYVDVAVGQYTGLKLTEPTGLTGGNIVINVASRNKVVGLNLNISEDSELDNSTTIYNQMLSTFKFTN